MAVATIPITTPIKKEKGMDDLRVVHVKVKGEQEMVNAVIDTGAQMPVDEKLIDHVVSRLEPQILDYVEVRHSQNTANLLQIVDKYEERFMNRQITGSNEGFRSSNPNENNRFNNRHRQENRRENRNNERYANNSRPQREFNRFENQGFANNQRFEGRRQGGQSDQ
ncbi:hypothetical protein TNCV_1502641 [Trichonephila clavipes]|uniref:Uncharacterized protein n=1 Tax=Trichonephila clavipes TaxID=2585209 RepID=A0A8X6UZE8_TRICX|nr:hypothetical protein TNCV_1502641 [Trichonephila clavipes]